MSPTKTLARNAYRNSLGFDRAFIDAAFGDDVYELQFDTIQAVVKYAQGFHTLIWVVNQQPGNGNFARFMDWLEAEAKEQNANLMVSDLWNRRLRLHLIQKRGYKATKRGNHVIKKFF